LKALGAQAIPVVWDDAAVDWPAFDLVVLRSTWDYISRREEFVAWARSIARLRNPAPVVERDTDKGPMLQGPDVGVEGLYKQEEITRREPTPAEPAVGEAAIAAAPQGLLYARVDLIPDAGGNPLLIELELTEPSLFFEYGDGAAERFAAAIAAQLG
jgi:hypothetical protein